MPRKTRIHFQGAFYHVMLRGNNHQPIFLDDTDRFNFFKIMEHAVEQFNCQIHLFCLMTNHLHLVIEIKHVPLWKIMLSITSSYAKQFNKRQNKLGHLFQNRYQANLIQNDNYMLELCYYIHLNPVRAKIVIDIDDYPWSSHHSYTGKKHYFWLTVEYINALLQKHSIEKKNYYIKFIHDRSTNFRQPVFCEFDESGEIVIKDSINTRLHNKVILNLENCPIQKIAHFICNYLGVEMCDLDSPSQARSVTLARSMITYFAHYHGKFLLRDIATLFRRTPDSISRTLQRHLKAANQDKYIANLINNLEHKLSSSDTDSLSL